MSKQYFFTLISLHLFTGIAFSQVFIEVGPVQNNRDAFSSVIVYGSDGLSRNIPYSLVNGSPFWHPEWMKADFYNMSGKPLGAYRAKFNYVAQEVHFLDSAGNEKAVSYGVLGRVVFFKPGDSLEIATVFRAGIEELFKQTTCKTCYVQELNQGHTRLLKITRRNVREADSLFGTQKRYFFADVTEYFVQTEDQYNKIKKLAREEFFSFVPGASLYKDWINTQKLNFKTEKDYLIFLEHYNNTYQKD